MKKAWIFLIWLVLGTLLIAYAWETMENRDRAWRLLGVWVVNNVVCLFQLALARWRPKKNPLSFFGIYLVLGPLSLMAWFNRSFEMWFVDVFALAGVLILWLATPTALSAREAGGVIPRNVELN